MLSKSPDSSPTSISSAISSARHAERNGFQKGAEVAYDFGSLVFTPTVKALQERHGSRKQYANREEHGPAHDRLGLMEKEFLEVRDSFYTATIGYQRTVLTNTTRAT